MKEFNDLKDFDVAPDDYRYLLGASYEESLILCFRYHGISFWSVIGCNEGDKNKGKNYWMHQPLPAGSQAGIEAIVVRNLRPELERYLEENKLKILINCDLVVEELHL